MLVHSPACPLSSPRCLSSFQLPTSGLRIPPRSQSRTVRSLAAQAGSPSWTGKNTPNPKNGKHHFLHIDDFSREELWAMLETARTTKEKLKANDQSYKPLAGKTMSMIFTKPSSRTRISFETVRKLQQCSYLCKLHIFTRLCMLGIGLLQAGRPCSLPGPRYHPIWQA